MQRFLTAAVLILTACRAGWAQQPVVADNGVLNLASQVIAGRPGHPVSPGSLVLIVGRDLAGSTEEAQKPYPTSLAGVEVTFNGTAAPIQSVSPDRIVVQLPWEVAPEGVTEGQTTMVVTRDGVSSWGNVVNWQSVSPGIFTVQLRARGYARAVDLETGDLTQPEGIFPDVTTRPAERGKTVRLFVSGLGPTDPAGRLGDDSSDQQRLTLITPEVLVGNKTAEVIRSRLSPIFPGVYEVDFVVPDTVVAGNTVPVQLRANGITTVRQVTIAVSLSEEERNSSLTVSATEEVRPFSDLLLGQAVFQPWHPYVTTGPEGNLVSDAMDLFLAPRAGIIGHYPGVGVITHDFHWKNLIGPLSSRTDPTPRHSNFDSPRMIEFGPDEYGQLVEKMREASGRPMEGSIQINIMTGSAEDAADWVEYMNAPNDGSNPRGGTDWAAVRAANGHPEPYRIRYWEMGNEPHFTAEEIGSLSAWEYVDRVRHYAWRMKQVDPTIEIAAYTNTFLIGGGADDLGSAAPDTRAGPPPEGIPDEDLTWSQAVIKYAGEYLDYLYFHWYSGWNQSVHPFDYVSATPYSGLEVWLRRLLDDVEVHAPTPNIKERLRRILVPEWNTYGGWFRPLSAGVAMQGAIASSRVLHVFSQHPEVAMAQRLGLAAGFPDPPLNVSEPTASIIDFRPGYFSLMYDGERFWRTALSEMHRLWGLTYLPVVARVSSRLPVSEGVPQADVTAFRSEDGTRLHLLITNPTGSELNLDIILDSFQPEGPGTVYRLAGASLLDNNTFDNPNRVSITESSFNPDGTRFQFTVEPHSVSAIHLTGQTLGL